MAKQIIHRIGTTAEHNNFVGGEGEWTHDVDLTTIRVHDGSTVGGFPLAKADGSNVGDFTVNGDLTVLGTTTTIESTEVTIEDKNITLANGSVDSSAADGAGFTIDGADVVFSWNHTETQMELNRAIQIAGYVDATGSGSFGGDLTVGGTFDCGTIA